MSAYEIDAFFLYICKSAYAQIYNKLLLGRNLT